MKVGLTLVLRDTLGHSLLMLGREMLSPTASGVKMYLDTFQSDYWLNGSKECTSLKQQSTGSVEQDNPLGEPILSPWLLNNSQIKLCLSAECLLWPWASREWDYFVNLDVAQGELDLAAAIPKNCRQSGGCHSWFFAPLHSFGATDFRYGSRRIRRSARQPLSHPGRRSCIQP